MRNDYKHLYSPLQVPSLRRIVAYVDPGRTDEERRANTSRIAKQQAKLRRAKIAERWIVFTVASMLAIAMLPVLVAVGAIMMGRALWRRCMQDWRWRRAEDTDDVSGAPANSRLLAYPWRTISTEHGAVAATAADTLPRSRRSIRV